MAPHLTLDRVDQRGANPHLLHVDFIFKIVKLHRIPVNIALEGHGKSRTACQHEQVDPKWGRFYISLLLFSHGIVFAPPLETTLH